MQEFLEIFILMCSFSNIIKTNFMIVGIIKYVRNVQKISNQSYINYTFESDNAILFLVTVVVVSI